MLIISMLCVIMLSTDVLNLVMLNVIRLSDVGVSVVAPRQICCLTVASWFCLRGRKVGRKEGRKIEKM